MLRSGLLGVALLALLATVDAACEADQVAHCTSCSNPGVECVSCPPGWRINNEKTACDICPDNCDRCEIVSGDTLQCLDCDILYALRDSDTACLKCSPGCGLCHHTTDDLTSCDVCLDGWTTSSTGTTCIECPNNCAECENGTAVCKECDESYFLMTDKSCKKCPTNCVQCSDNGEGIGSCSKCIDNYLVNSDAPTGSCLSCSSSCKSCVGEVRADTIAVCDICEDAYALDNDECVSCDPNCVDCSTSSTCAKCREGYRVDSGDGCTLCPDNCLDCALDEDNEDICDECDEGYVPKDEVTCDECGSNCDTCTLGGGCDTCEDGFAPDDSGDCQQCPSRCLDCSYSSGRTKCKSNSCETGYVVDDNGDCKSCPEGCQDNQCSWRSSKSICNGCNSAVQPRTLNADNTACLDCPSDCASCSYNNTGDGRIVCDECDSYFGVLEEECDACPDKCNACTYNDTAEAMDCDSQSDCDEGFRLGEDEGADGNDICVDCTTEFCNRCNATDGCTECISPYKLTGAAECLACPDHCNSCRLNGDESDTECVSETECDPGYGLSNDDKCPSCRSRCLNCPMNSDGDNPCKSDNCESEYTDDDDGDCKACPGKCNECSWSNADSRTTCDSGECYERYALVTTGSGDGSCAICPDNCETCEWKDGGDGGDAKTWCTVCDSEYDLKESDGTCVACPDFCGECTYNVDTEATECDSNEACDSGYGITDEFKCKECPYHCEDCTQNDESLVMECDICKTHYVDNSGVCGACPDHCTVCTHDSGNIDCTTCEDGYALFQGECLSCPTYCTECTANSAGVTQCKDNMCRTGYGVNSGKTCSACSAMFTNCKRCGDSTGTDDQGADMADCYECNSPYTLADDASTCKDTFSGTCSKFEDRKYVCSPGSCDEGYVEMSNGSCSSMCYTCGSTRNNELLDYDTCVKNWDADANGTTTEVCLNDCWITTEFIAGVKKEARVARGCHIPDEDFERDSALTCKKAKGGYCKNIDIDGVKTKRCWKCCQGNLCNDFGAGSAAIQAACTALLMSAVLALYM